MHNTAALTDPFSHSQTFHASRRAAAGTAVGTGLGAVSLVRLNKDCPVPHGFIAEHRAKRRPTRIKDGLCHLRASQCRAIHIADADQAVLSRDQRGRFMQEVPSLRSDLPMYLPSERFSASALCSSQLSLRLSNVAGISKLLTRRQPGKIGQAKVYANFPVTQRQFIRHLTDEIQIPSAGRVLAEGTRADIVWDRTAEPKSISSTKECDGIAINLQRPSALERNPSEGSLGATASTPPGALSRLITASGELLADVGDSVAMQAEQFGRTCGQFDQVKAAGPAAVQASAIVLDAAAIIPDLIYGPSHSREMLSGCRVLDPVAVSQYHRAGLWSVAADRRSSARRALARSTGAHLYVRKQLPATKIGLLLIPEGQA